MVKWEAGQRRPSLASMAELADVYGLDVRDRVRLVEAMGFRFRPLASTVTGAQGSGRPRGHECDQRAPEAV